MSAERAERFRRVRALFDEAAALPSEQRAAFVRNAAAGDAALERDVLKLLASVESAQQGGFLGEPAWKRGPAEAAVKTGEWFGPYRVVRKLSAGGMGSVYLVMRADDVYQRQAALKIIRADCMTEALVHRFHQERQILARVDHPNIARIIDGGTTSTGLPYFVMDFVDGEHLHVFCTKRRLNVEARLRLFATVCRAVEYLHHNQIVHRDLKPSNILVCADGTVKLVDFGIAKFLDDAAHATQTSPLLTPGYASPEQLMNEAAGPPSDVYSLGVVLYELLTGQRPFQRHESTLQQLITTVSGSPPPAPSSIAGVNARHVTPENPAQLRRRLSGDLDTILMMALRREPVRRYLDAGALASDIERHLGGQPVAARRDTISYRGGKFLRRNWIGAAAALAVCGAVGWGVSEHLERTRLQKRIEELEDATRRELARAEKEPGESDYKRHVENVQAVGESFKTTFTESLRLKPGMTPERDVLVKRGESYIDKLLQIPGAERFRGEIAAAYLLFGDVRGYPGRPNLGDRAGALRLYERARQIAAQDQRDVLAQEILRIAGEHESRTRRPAVP
jgi:serine/threonine protein kinase